ncbi:hypothetical protein GZH47_33775 (plasmid) [Paenibacillus rhizovicinus]|uniref:Uncharacterized protein n=1 Tax=Paenibacillus rhizovicinus TaxID=2704463 RepID=A0A6C0PCZ9_9BACL|nr:hypothetical protein [Paenibacillus rhizovicinus]QHW35862.1 hypothetical protein GZH47_33775 [Paenibacillus rhizovicinus]
MRMPTSKGGGAQFRGPTSSHDYNTNEDDKYLEMVELYRQSNENLAQLTEVHQIVLAEHAAQQQYISLLESKMASMEEQLTGIEAVTPYEPIFSKSTFALNMKAKYPAAAQELADTALRCDVDPAYRLVTLPIIHQIPKTHLVNDKSGEIIVPSELKVKVGRTNTGGTVSDNDVINAFNGDNESFWQRKVSYDFSAAPDQEDAVLEIELPSHLVNNLNINTITIHPHPERGIQIQNIEMHYANAWQQIKGFTQDEISSIDTYEFAPRKKWYFPSVPVQKIRITLVQKNPIDLNGKKVFVLGAQEISVLLTMFEPGGGFILSPFSMDGIYNIESIDHVFLNRSAFSYDTKLDHLLDGAIYEYEVLKEEMDGTLVPLQSYEWTGQYARTLWVKTKLYPDPNNGVNPCLHAVRLNYSR